ncbi:MAG TPA: tetratricopeptide repeat protein, partial [Rhodothermales bacterium]|nr:tetratricopeptide repeat protein [Rhodothermales bacterium]
LGGLLLLTGCRKQAPPPPPLDPATHQMLMVAEQALDDQDYALALALADSAARRVPGAVETDFLKGMIYSRMMRWGEADSLYRRVAERAPDFPGVWNNLGNNAVWQGAYQKALSDFYKEVARKPAPIPWASIGRVYQELGVIDSASYAFEQAIELDSTYIPAYLSYAGLLEDGGEFEHALSITERAAALAPESAEVEYMMGSLLARVGRDSEAVAYLESVVQTWPWHTESHYKLGQALQRLGRSEESRAVLAEAEELWKRQADVTAYQKGVAADPENPYRHAALATAFRMAGRYDEAIHAYKLALSLDPANLEFQNNLASLYFLKKDTTSAIQTYRRILKQDPKMVEVWVNLGVLYALSGAEDDARQAWQHALTYRPDDPTTRAYLAKLNAGD